MLPLAFKKATALCIALSVLSACNPTSSNLSGEPGSCEIEGGTYGIVGGKILATGNNLSSSTVMVLHKSVSDEVSICTGTLINNDKVLTAAHCTSTWGKVAIAFTNNIDCLGKAPKRTTRMVTAQAVHPDYSYFRKEVSNASNDLAVLKFEGTLPAGYVVRDLPSAAFVISQQDEMAMVGYGTTSEKAEDSGTLRFTTAPADRLLTHFKRAYNRETVYADQTLILEQPNNGVCTGDSGGPLYANKKGQLTLVGITSMGVDHRATSDKEARICHGVSLFTDIRTHLDWIVSKKNSL